MPSTSALQAFESAGRLLNFSRAAEELHTSQSAISRHVATLEARLDTALFDRRRRKQLALTYQGEQLYRAVVAGFDGIQGAIDAIAGTRDDAQVTIACTHENSHLILLPRFDALQQALGDDKTIRVMTYEYDAMRRALDPRVDITIRYDVEESKPADRVPIVREAIRPVVSPTFLAANESRLRDDMAEWLSLPFLELSKHNYGWASWEDWFTAQQIGASRPAYQHFNNYIYLLEAAAAGKGVALGWRGLVDRYIEAGVLVEIGPDYVEFERAIHAVLTETGRNRPLARRCLEQLGRLGQRP